MINLNWCLINVKKYKMNKILNYVIKILLNIILNLKMNNHQKLLNNYLKL
jgi:hypothetical protein